eukprot:jgi/Picsp_1/581/NSC_00578-R1_---NA---
MDKKGESEGSPYVGSTYILPYFNAPPAEPYFSGCVSRLRPSGALLAFCSPSTTSDVVKIATHNEQSPHSVMLPTKLA